MGAAIVAAQASPTQCWSPTSPAPASSASAAAAPPAAVLLPQAGEIFTLYVAPEHQERGIGRALLFRLFEGLTDRGLNSAVVWVLAQNPARFFYEAMGGRRIAAKQERLWNTTLPQVAYGWDDLRLVHGSDRDPDT